ncbi:V-type proton ATPase 116 kDa subunit a 1-like [Ostrinia nubilalis]|uniref:V-type proton ATPase 116 kDa subunit a 1-like n=1 Tax=Ostrinia nubilalis TaxID=29057 RepID=UPI00308249AE
MSTNHVNLLKNYVELTEMYYVLDQIGPLLGDTEFRRESLLNKDKSSSKSPRLVEQGQLGAQLVIFTGVVRRSRSFPFEMMLWRISRGNIYYRQASHDKLIQDPKTNQEIRKVAFLAICQGEELNNRMQKVCSGFGVNVYPCPKTFDERMEMIAKIGYRILDLEQVIKKTHYHRCKALRVIARQWHTWMIQVKKAKAIYHNLNLFNLDITKNCLIGQCWVPDTDLRLVQDSLEITSQSVGTTVPSFMSKTETNAKPPTYHRTNKFTYGFQNLINAYGESTYRELNPGLYTLITFPFLFALMFADIGHGLIMLMFGIWMVVDEKKLMAQRSTNEIWKIFFGGRYVILMMGMFSIYAGFIYNDCFSKPFNMMGSYWLNHYTRTELADFEQLDLNPSLDTRKVYWFGIDPVWALSANHIMVTNSIKMKLSIIVGVVHMIFGIVLSLFDHMYFKRYYAIVLEFIPQILFLTCIFFWLVFMIFFKWFTYGAKETNIVKTPGCAPQILILFIDMVLLSKTKPLEEDCEAYMFEIQREFQLGLVAAAGLCVPVLLFGTPLYLVRQNKKRRDAALNKISNFRRYQQRRESDKKAEEKILADIERYSQPFGELMIHQGVSTIEFVLSTISHTASYLRLWALSLAHAELSDILWNMVLQAGRDYENTIKCVLLPIKFACWAFFTVTILVVMEGLSAFLHTLRLHWVEFMSKFYLGRGWMFHPFSFKTICAEGDDKADNICKKKAKAEDTVESHKV